MVDLVPLSRIVGERLRRLRSANGVPMERVAAEARQLGLGWAKSSVAALEAGRRALDLGELLLMPTILGRAQVWAFEQSMFGDDDPRTRRHPVGLADLIPNDERRVLLAGSTHTSARALHTLLSKLRGLAIEMQGARPETGAAASDEARRILSSLWCLRIFETIRGHQASAHHRQHWNPDDDDTFWPEVARDAVADATRKAASALGVPSLAVALAAHALWHWSLTAEREHRLIHSLILAVVPNARFTDHTKIERDWNLTEGQKQVLRDWHTRGGQERALPPAPRRKLQAMRGHFTRDLIQELRPLLKDVTSKKKSTTRRGKTQ